MSKKVLITGANKGIGFETARQLGEQGWYILLGARNEQRGMEAVNTLQREGINVEWVRIDLNHDETIDSAAQYIRVHHSDINVLINNAGVSGNMQAKPLDVDVDELRSLTEVNFFGNFQMIKAFTPILARNKGRIVNLSITFKPSSFFSTFSYIDLCVNPA